MSRVAKVKFVDYKTSIGEALDLISAGSHLPQEGLIIIKPNLTNSSPPPVTTNVAAAEGVYHYCKGHTKAEIAIGEGSGSGRTADVFAALGYEELAKKYGLRLIDFNEAGAVVVEDPHALHLKQFYMPEMVPEAFVISLPVLKSHSFTRTSIAMKNMFGIAPGRYYAGSWNKSKLHRPSTDRSVVDVCMYKKPDLSVVDASMALKGTHLWGKREQMGIILAGFDPVAVDAVGSELLGHKAERLEYLRLANGLLGSMDNIQVIKD